MALTLTLIKSRPTLQLRSKSLKCHHYIHNLCPCLWRTECMPSAQINSFTLTRGMKVEFLQPSQFFHAADQPSLQHCAFRSLTRITITRLSKPAQQFIQMLPQRASPSAFHWHSKTQEWNLVTRGSYWDKNQEAWDTIIPVLLNLLHLTCVLQRSAIFGIQFNIRS